MAGLGPHARLDNTLKAALVEKAVEPSVVLILPL
jgi:hypothetical protein